MCWKSPADFFTVSDSFTALLPRGATVTSWQALNLFVFFLSWSDNNVHALNYIFNSDGLCFLQRLPFLYPGKSYFFYLQLLCVFKEQRCSFIQRIVASLNFYISRFGLVVGCGSCQAADGDVEQHQRETDWHRCCGFANHVSLFRRGTLGPRTFRTLLQ